MDEKAAVERIERQWKRSTLEVEYLLRLARTPSPALADHLNHLADSNGWSHDAGFPQIPWRRWVSVVAIYCRESYAGLVRAAADFSMLRFVTGLLEELHSSEALEAVVAITLSQRERLSTDRSARHDIIDALNLIAMRVSRASDLAIPQSDFTAVRDFLHDSASCAASEGEWGSILCALRYFGDNASLQIVECCPAVPEHWEGARRAAIRGIKKTIRKQARAA